MELPAFTTVNGIDLAMHICNAFKALLEVK